MSFNRSILLKEHKPLTDEILIPTASYIEDTESLEKKPYRFRTNEEGFIIGSDESTDLKKNQSIDIIFMGGSTTECIFVDEDARFPYLVSKILQNIDNSPIKTINGGVSGNHSIHSLLNFLSKGIPLKPNFIVLMHGINDAGTLYNTFSYWDAPISRSIVQVNKTESSFPQILKIFKDIIAPNIWKKTRHLFEDKMSVLYEDEWANYRNKNDKNIDELKNLLKKDFKSSLISFVKVAKAWKIEPIFMTQFNRINLDDEKIKESYEKKQHLIPYESFVILHKLSMDIVREVAEEEDVFLIDLAKKVSSTPKYIYDSVHLNREGSELVAQIISKELAAKYPNKFILP